MALIVRWLSTVMLQFPTWSCVENSWKIKTTVFGMLRSVVWKKLTTFQRYLLPPSSKRFLPTYMAQYPRRQSSLYSPTWEPEISPSMKKPCTNLPPNREAIYKGLEGQRKTTKPYSRQPSSGLRSEFRNFGILIRSANCWTVKSHRSWRG
jgi:hypothetical protein